MEAQTKRWFNGLRERGYQTVKGSTFRLSKSDIAHDAEFLQRTELILCCFFFFFANLNWHAFFLALKAWQETRGKQLNPVWLMTSS